MTEGHNDRKTQWHKDRKTKTRKDNKMNSDIFQANSDELSWNKKTKRERHNVVSSRSIDLLNSTIYQSRWSDDLRWLLPVLHSS